MKKITFTLLALLAMHSSVSAQRMKYISTFSEKLNTEALTQNDLPFQLHRTLLAGYNTICLPMDMNAEQVQLAAKDVQVERLMAIKQEGSTLNLYFIDCTSEGIQAGVPYLIYSPTIQTLKAKSTQAGKVDLKLKNVCLTDGKGNQVTFNSSWDAITTAGRYGIPAQQDAYILESVLIRTNADKKFLPTRCGFTWDKQSVSAQEIKIKHITSTDGMATGIDKLQVSGDRADVYDTKGALVKKQATVEEALSSLPKGIYVMNGEKIAIK